MKKINTLLLALLSVVALTWTSCNDSVDYTPAGAVEGQGVYFDPSSTTNYELEGESGSITLNVMRTYATGAAEVPVNATFSEGSDLFTVPATVSFAAESLTSEMTMSFDNLVRGTTYTVTLAFDDSTPYGLSSLTLTFLYPEESVEVWEVISEEAVLTENMFSAFGTVPVTITGITVEKEATTNKYRFRSPYNNAYFVENWGVSVFADDSNLPYIVLDGETYADAGYYIDQTALGFVMVNGVGPQEDATWNTFGSVAGNLQTSAGPVQPGDPTYPLGTYDTKSKMFDFGSCYFNIGDYGFAVLNPGTFTLYLDPSLMGTDYDRDYTWQDVPEAAGLFTSELAEGSWIQAVQVAEEDSTFYRMPNLYSNAEKAHFYFHLDQETGAVTIPRGQDVGLTSFGNIVRIQGTPNRSSFNAETGTLTLGLTLYLSNADGDNLADLTQVSETFLWGQTSEFVEGTTIDDYVGNWVVTFDNAQGTGGQSLVTITKEDDATLRVNGLSLVDPAEYDDSMFLDYIAENGQVSFSFQQVASDGEYLGFVAPFNSVTTSFGESLTGGLTRNGNLKFVDAATNEGTYDAMAYLISPDGSQFGFLTGYWNYLEWEPYTEAPASRAANSYQQPLTTFSPLTGELAPRRTYKTELNLTPQPAGSKHANVSVEGKSSVVFEAVK